jgi:hypothetical protein
VFVGVGVPVGVSVGVGVGVGVTVGVWVGVLQAGVIPICTSRMASPGVGVVSPALPPGL